MGAEVVVAGRKLRNWMRAVRKRGLWKCCVGGGGGGGGGGSAGWGGVREGGCRGGVGGGGWEGG